MAEGMQAVGVCWRRRGWIFSFYRRSGDAYPTLKVRRAGRSQLDGSTFTFKLKLALEGVSEPVGGPGKD